MSIWQKGLATKRRRLPKRPAETSATIKKRCPYLFVLVRRWISHMQPTYSLYATSEQWQRVQVQS
jgi:hypothetical protein